MYSGCFTEYGCFGSPPDCEAAKRCDVLFTYVTDDSVIRMGLMGKQEGNYAAVGFSEDSSMVSKTRTQCSR